MSGLQMTARQIMTTPVVTVTPQMLVHDAVLADEARRIIEEFTLFGEEVQISGERGVFVLRGLVASPGRRSALLRRLWEVDGVVAIDDRELKDAYRETVGMWD